MIDDHEPRDLAAEALANCESDPIRTPGAIQPQGALLAVDLESGCITYASANLVDVIARDAAALLGERIDRVLDRTLLHNMNNALSHSTIESQRESIGQLESAPEARRVDVALHRRGDLAILELQPMAADAGATNALEKVQWLLAQLASRDDLNGLLAHAVEFLRDLSNYDRVMVYRFLHDGAGEVVAESRGAHVEDTYKGLRYPAYDIPQQARDLYRSTPIRIIGDVTAENVDLLAADSAATADLDLSLAVLRGTMPVHLQYLKNMGVTATLTLPIVVEQQLWGLFAFHSQTARHPDPSTTMALELCGKVLSMQVEQAVLFDRERLAQGCIQVASMFVAANDSELSTESYWPLARDRLLELLSAQGIAYRAGNHLERHGRCPPLEQCLSLCALEDGGGIRAYESLSSMLPDGLWDGIAGALVLPLSLERNTYLIYFRDAVSRTITWAGKPAKDLEVSLDGVRLHPRGSFAAYEESMEGHCDAWTPPELDVARALQSALQNALATQSELRDNRHRLGLVVRELNHRVRNILALINAMAKQSATGARSIEEYTEALEKRILALAGAHNLLTDSEEQCVSLRTVVEHELRPFVSESLLTVSISGPDLELSSGATPVFVLVVHELAANAAKYGALSTATGRVAVSWRLEADGVMLRWRESGGPEVAQPSRYGFGRTVIEEAVRYELGGRSALNFLPHGVESDIWIPAEHVVRTSSQESATAPTIAPLATPRPAPPRESAPIEDRKILILEDDFMIMAELRRMLSDLNLAPTYCCATVEQARQVVVETPLEFCLLDVNIRGGSSEPVAHMLAERGIPFAFCTGYGSTAVADVKLRSYPTLKKPIFKADLELALQQLGLVSPT